MSAGRHLVIERAGRTWALNAPTVAEILADRPIQPVPLAPPAVAGIVIDRGRSFTVLDLDSMLRLATAETPPSYLVVLGPPYSNLALRVHGTVCFEPQGLRALPPEQLDLEQLVASIESALAIPAD